MKEKKYVYGKDNLTIADKTPSGSPYLEDLPLHFYSPSECQKPCIFVSQRFLIVSKF
jgi:hypothetical protein